MAHDVFVSYSSRDKPIADAAVARMEAGGIRCFVAPRDILPGSDWGEAIVAGIEQAKVFVLVFSSNANASQQIKREVERAVNKGLTIVPLRIEDVLPAGNLEYFLGTPHWLDAVTPPIEQHLDYLARTVRFLLDRQVSPLATPPARPAVPRRAAAGQRRPWLLPAGLLVGVGIIALLVVLLTTGGDDDAGASGTGTSQASTATFDRRFVGSWEGSVASDDASASFEMTYSTAGKFTTTLTFEEQGRYDFQVQDWVTLYPDTGLRSTLGRATDWKPQGDTVTSSGFSLYPDVMTQYLILAGGNRTTNFLLGQLVLHRTKTASGETWAGSQTALGLTYQTTLELGSDARYHFKSVAKDSGSFTTTTEGKWKTVSAQTGSTEGSFDFIDRDQVTMTGPAGQLIWKRKK